MARPFSPCFISFSFIPWVVVLLLAGGETAQAKFSLSVSPPLIETTLVPGGVRRFTVTVINEGDEGAQVSMRTVPFGLSPQGEVVFLEESPYSLLPWMTARGENSFFLGAGEEREILFEVRAPRSGKGGRYGAVLFEALPSNVLQGMAVGIRLGTLILAVFPRSSGPRGEIRSVWKQNGVIGVEVENTGDVHFAVTECEAVLRAETGRILRRIIFSGCGLLLPGGVRVLQGELKEGSGETGPCTLEIRVFTRKGSRRLLLDRMSVSYPIGGGEGREEDSVDVSVEAVPGNKNK